MRSRHSGVPLTLVVPSTERRPDGSIRLPSRRGRCALCGRPLDGTALLERGELWHLGCRRRDPRPWTVEIRRIDSAPIVVVEPGQAQILDLGVDTVDLGVARCLRYGFTPVLSPLIAQNRLPLAARIANDAIVSRAHGVIARRPGLSRDLAGISEVVVCAGTGTSDLAAAVRGGRLTAARATVS